MCSLKYMYVKKKNKKNALMGICDIIVTMKIKGLYNI